MQNIPSLPPCVSELLRATEDPGTDAGYVAGILEKDVGLATKVLRLANSPLYGLRSQVSTITHAVSMLGFKTTRELAFTASLFRMFDSDPSGSPMAIWRHSVCTALASRVLGRHLGIEAAEDVFAAALVHDIGKFVLLQSIPQAFHSVVQLTGLSRKAARRRARTRRQQGDGQKITN